MSAALPITNSTLNAQQRLSVFLRVLLSCLLGMFVTGVGMVDIGQPSSSHVISHAGNTFWHILFVIHMIFLAGMMLSALATFIVAVKAVRSIRTQAVLGIIIILLGSLCGSLAFQNIHPAFFLFCVALSFLALGATYGQLLGRTLSDKRGT